MTATLLIMFGGATLAWLLLTIVEMIGRGMFASWAYRLGPRVIADEYSGLDVSAPKAIGRTVFTTNGAYRWISDDRLLYRPRFRFLVRPGLGDLVQTPFPIGCEGTVDRGTLRVEGRMPISPLLFFGCWLAILLAFAVGMALSGAAVAGILLLVGFWSVGATMFWFSHSLEIRRATRIVAEIRSDLAASGEGPG